MSEILKLKRGDIVVWTSQSQGVDKTKEGVVVAVVAAGHHPFSCLPSGMRIVNPGGPRKHESYLIQVGTRKNLYWPVVSLLKKAVKP